MSIEILLKELLENNVKLTVREDKLLCQLPEAGIDDKLLNSLKEHKEALKKILLQKTNFKKYQAIPQTAKMDSYPLTSSQKRLWILSQFEGGSQAYNMSFVTKITGELDAFYFEKSFKELIAQHEILRTIFRSDVETQEVMQIIVPINEVDLSIEQLDFSANTDCNEKVENYLDLKNKEPFDLEKTPLVRVSLIKIAKNEFVFFLSMHHIISDGWSMELMVSEIVQRYNNLLANKEHAIPALAIQYKDYALWLEDEMQKEKYQESEKYWLEKFAGDLTTLNLPSSKQRPSIQTFNGNNLSYTFSEEFTARMKSFSEDNKVTLFTTLMAVVKALLYRYSGQDDIIVGTPIAGREHPDLENQIGLYVNTLAIRTQFNEKNTFADLLQIEKNNLTAANEHQMYPFDELVKKLNLKRDLRRSVLFDVMVVYQNQSLLNLGNKKEDADNLSFEKYDLRKKTAQFDISFNFSESNNQLELNIEYNTDIYDVALIERMLSHFDNFSAKALLQPEMLIEEIDYLTDAEKNQLLFDFNDTNVDYPKDKTIVDLFEEQVSKTPNNIAVVFQEIELTYKQLNEQANQLAHYLRENYAIKPDDLVGIKLDRSERMIISILGVLKSGGAYVPIDPDYPQDRIEYIEKDSNSKLVIDDNELELFYKNQEQYSDLNLDKVNSPDDLIYVIYTSGTTGNPKGTLLEHKNVVRLFFTDKPLFDFSENDVWTMFHSYSFDFSVWEINGALLFGGKLVVVPKLIAQNTPAFLELLQNQSVTILNQTPSSFYNLINNERAEEKKCEKLRYVIFGGEALNPTLLLDWHRKYPDTKLINMYGITETTVHVTFKEINEKEIHSEQSNIGKPIPTLSCYILDAYKQMVPIGVTGELYVAGLGLARGYLNLPELTTKKFISNPFIEGERLYDSGDLACWLPDGNIEYFGRKDQQVKIRGYRIELGDIENAILQYSDAVKQVVVEVKVNNQEKVLVAYLVSTSDIDKPELRRFLQGKLPDYMIPGFYLALDMLPLTHNGKINRKALPNISEQDIIKKEYVAPRNDIEQSLVAIWQEMLGIEKIGITDNFFDLGGHSLIVAQVINRIHKQLGQTVSFTAFFEKPTIADLSAQLQKNDYLAIPKAPEAASYPLTASQSRLWILSQLEGGSLAYNIPAAVKLTGIVDTVKFNESFQLLIDRYEILRTSFRTNEEGDIRQFILPSEEINFNVEEKDFSTSDNQENDIAVYFQDTINTPFNLEQAPLVRASLIKTQEKEYVFFLGLHHIIGDGWSIELLISEIVKIYNALTQGIAVNLPQLNIQYKDYAVWLNEALLQEKHQVSEQYWLQQFEGELPVLNLPSFKTRPLVQTYNGDYLTHQFSKEFLKKVKTFSKQQDVTLFMTLMAGINTLLHRYTGLDDIIIGTPIAGREHPDLENQMGLYLNTLAIRTRLKEKSSFLELLVVQKETLLDAYDHQSYPFDALVGKLNLKRDSSRSALFDVLVVLQNQGQLNTLNTEKLADLEVNDYQFERKTSQLDISFTFIETEGLDLAIEYNTDIYDEYLIERMFVHFENLFTIFLEQPEVLIAEVDYLTEAEKQQLLFDFNETVVDYPIDKTIVDLFEAQVAKTPNNVAVVFEDITLTYSELNEQANQLAHYLRENYAIQPDDLVGIKLDRSEWMIITIFGVLKSGAAYVPIDINYPQERITYIEQDSNSKVVIDEATVKLFTQVHEKYSKENLERINQPNDLAYVIYTSGTTGNPKGVMIEHFSVVSISENWKKHYALDEIDVNLLQLASISFDVFVGDVCRSILNGGKMIICSNDVKLNPEHLFELMQKQKISILEGTPGLLLPLMDYINNEKKDYSFLKIVIFGSDSFNNQDYNALKDKFGKNIKIINSYGVTEATIDSTYYDDYKKDLNGFTPIGKPFSNSKIKIVDSYGNLVPTGIYGEIYIGGDGLARGYFNQEDLTAEKFVINPFKTAEKLYKTGDLGRWFADGNIDFAGRKDNQVKIRGYRIELGEIESTLQKNEDIDSCVVLARKNSFGEKCLVAYIVSKKELNTSDLMSFLLVFLPNYMIPSYFVQIEALPLTPNGKVDRKALPDPEESRISSGIEYIAPKSEAEKSIAAIWQEVLNVEKIGVNDNFFELGGHSLLLAQIINKIYKQLGQTVSFTAFFNSPTVAGLSAQLQKNDYQAIPIAPEAASYPLTASQSRLWILSQLEGGSLAYNMPAAVKLTGVIDAHKFNESFQLLIGRHEILRTCFKTNEEGDIRQYIIPSEEINFRITEKDFSASTHHKNAINAYLQEIIATPFNLEEAPLVNASLIKAKEDEYVFFLSLHHIIADGLSIELLVFEIVKIYNALMQGIEIKLPQLNIQYKDYAVWMNEALQQEKHQKSEQYWLQQFEGELPVLDLPSFRTRPLVRTYKGDYLNHQFSKEFFQKIKNFSQERDVTLFMTLMSGINALLHRYTGMDDMIIGTPISGREHPDLENQIGLYLNTFAIRTRLKEKSSFLDLLTAQKETLLDAYDHQSYPFDALVGKLNLKRDTSRSALFDVFVVLQNQTQLNTEPEELVNLEVKDYPFSRKVSQFDINFTFNETDELELGIEYNTAIYDEYLIQRMFAHFENLLTLFIDQPETLLAEADYLKDTERQQLLLDFNDTAIAYPKDKTVVHLFEEQVARTPDNEALKDDFKSYTYLELDILSNQIAEYLITTYGKEDKSPIAVLLGRSANMVVFLLGILKSGRSYIPLDPAFPEDRLTYIIENSESKILIYEKEYKLESAGTIERVAVETIMEGIYHYDGNVSALISPKETAYIIFTSGSTGNPKGVEIGHQSLVNFLTSMQQKLKLGSNDSLFSVTTYSFDISILEFFMPLLSGASLYMASQEVIVNPLLIIEKLEKIKPTIIQATPNFYQMLFNADWNGSKELKVLCGGDLLSESLAEKLVSNSLEAWNMYGPTETTIWSSMKKIVQPKDASNIGKPINNTQLYILDEFFNPLPIGVSGAIYIAGDGLAKGYYKKESLTKEKFIKNPFGDNSLLYETGDVGKWNDKGEIEFLGRNDSQVKLRGYRMELGDIENAIALYSDTIQQIVVAVKENNQEKVLVAYLVSDSDVDKSALRTFLQKKLPEYMIPGFYVSLKELPLTSNGKINRKALPEIEENDLIRREYEAPCNEVESRLVAVWQEILNIEKIGTTDNFFELGGTSFQIIKLHKKIELLWPQRMVISDLFEFNSIKDIALFINKNSEETALEEEKEEMRFFEI